MICPHHCVCQYAHRMDLSISRWIHAVETRQRKGHEFTDSGEDSLNNNEVSLPKTRRTINQCHAPSHPQVNFDDEILPQNNELLKFTMCLLPSNIEPKDLIASLPHDVEALVILSTENRKNLSGECGRTSLSNFTLVIYSLGQRLQSTFRPEDFGDSRFERNSFHAAV